jgi:hypothetical protein
MPGGDGTGPFGTLRNCTDPVTGLMRPLYRYRYGGYAPPAATPPNYIPPSPPAYPRYYGYGYGRYPYGRYPYGGYGFPGYGRGFYGFGFGRGMGWGRGRRGRGRGWW